MRSAFDFTPFRRSAVGFDRLFDMLESSAASGAGENYPPFDLIREGEHEYRIELAVAGFRREEIEITSSSRPAMSARGPWPATIPARRRNVSHSAGPNRSKTGGE